MKSIFKLLIVFFISFISYFISDLFLDYRGDIYDMGALYYVILSIPSLFNSIFIYFLLKFDIGKVNKFNNLEVFFLTIYLLILVLITNKFLDIIPQSGDLRFLLKFPFAGLYVYTFFIFTLLLRSYILRKKNKTI